MTLLFLIALSLFPKHHTALGPNIVAGSDTSKKVAYLPRKAAASVRPFSGAQEAQRRSIVFLPVTKPLLNGPEMVSGGLAITYGLFELDDEIYGALRGIRTRSETLSSVSPVISTMGLGTFSVALFSGFYAFHFITGDRSSLAAANLGMESFLLSGIATQILKNTFGRERPSMATRESGRWNGPLAYFEHRDNGSKSIASYDAFPSGHTATIFAAAATIADSYPERWVPYAAYGTATLVGISRIMESAHWPSDVFVGAIIGIASTKIVESLPFNKKMPRVHLSLDNNSARVGLSFHF